MSLRNDSILDHQSTFHKFDTSLCRVPTVQLQENSDIMMREYPQINLSCEQFTSTIDRFSMRNMESWRNVLVVPANESTIKRITRIFFEDGFGEALHEARKIPMPFGVAIASWLLKVRNYLISLEMDIFPGLNECLEYDISEYSETRCWQYAYVRSMAWHPNHFKLAVAGLDDVIRIYTNSRAILPVLKSSRQKSITAMAWRPYTIGTLAVACKGGICLWKVEGNFHISRSFSQEVFLHHPEKYPTTSLQWSRCGSLLATASLGDADVLIWNVEKRINVPLQRVGASTLFLRWSPRGERLFAATTESVFRIWLCSDRWVPDRWTILEGRVKSACWSPCGTFLLFLTTASTFLFRLAFFHNTMSEGKVGIDTAVPIVNLSKMDINGTEVGGQPQALVWNANGHYLAVTFKDSPCVAVFTTSVQHNNLNISALYYIAGVGSEYPSCICFQSITPKYANSVLTIGWSSGRIQFIPLNCI